MGKGYEWKTTVQLPTTSLVVALLLIFLSTIASSSNSEGIAKEKKLPIVYVYTVVKSSCAKGLPEYIKISLEQAIFSQPDSEVIIASNVGACPLINDMLHSIVNLTVIDASAVRSERTAKFETSSNEIFQNDNPLWMTSALRFFIMEDIMKAKGYTEMMHIEADNMLYGRLSTILPVLRRGYNGTAATPLNAGKSLITASVFWVASMSSLLKFNDYLFGIAHNTGGLYKDYLTWLRPFACCKPGGIDPDENGNGIKPFAVNEMSMLAYYHELYPTEFKLLPVVPKQTYILNRYVIDMAIYSPGGKEVGPPTGSGIWDSNSWGQFIGGTSNKRGRDKGFTDPTHISGQAIRTTGCKVGMQCGNFTEMFDYGLTGYKDGDVVDSKKKSICYTAPHVKCNGGEVWTPLWNLHVHSKHTINYMSLPCDCGVEKNL